MKLKFSATLMSMLMLGAAIPAGAQSFYDDDIYDASKPVVKPKKTETSAHSTTKRQQESVPSLSGTGYYYGGDGNIYPEYKAAGSYIYDSGNMRDIDEYNRRGIFARNTTDSVPADSLGDNFAYTRRLERFHDPDIVSGSNDDQLKEYYYSENTAPSSSVNIYLVDTWPYYNPIGWSYFGPTWSFTWGYRPWFSWSWGYYDPYWAWNWGPSWGWGPAWGPSWSWGPSYGHHHHTGIGSSMTHRPAYAGTHNVRRPGAGVGSRPGTGGVGVGIRPSGSQRPGATGTNVRPGTNTNNSRPGANIRPGANSSAGYNRPGYNQNRRPGVSTQYQGSRPGVQRQPSHNENRTGSYNRPSFGSGNRSGFSGGGSRGSRSGGGSSSGRGSRR